MNDIEIKRQELRKRIERLENKLDEGLANQLMEDDKAVYMSEIGVLREWLDYLDKNDIYQLHGKDCPHCKEDKRAVSNG